MTIVNKDKQSDKIDRSIRAEAQFSFIKNKVSDYSGEPSIISNHYKHTVPAKELPKVTDLSPEGQQYAKGMYGKDDERFTREEVKDTIHNRDFAENQASWNVEPSSWDEHGKYGPQPDCPQCEAKQWHAAHLNARPSKASGVCRSCHGLRDTDSGSCNCG